jgi:hypothetical protein
MTNATKWRIWNFLNPFLKLLVSVLLWYAIVKLFTTGSAVWMFVIGLAFVFGYPIFTIDNSDNVS